MTLLHTHRKLVAQPTVQTESLWLGRVQSLYLSDFKNLKTLSDMDRDGTSVLDGLQPRLLRSELLTEQRYCAYQAL